MPSSRSSRAVGAALALAFVALTSAPAIGSPADPAPMSAEAIPLFPGLTLVGDRADENGGGGLSDWGTPYPVIEARVRSYRTTATAEEVFAFYQQRLGGKTEWTEADDHTHIGPGQATPIQQTRHPYRLQDTMNAATQRAIPASMQRALLQANRPASAQGDWLQEGSFSWVVKDQAGAPVSFDVQVVDGSVAPNWTGYAPLTTVTVHMTRYGLIEDED